MILRDTKWQCDRDCLEMVRESHYKETFKQYLNDQKEVAMRTSGKKIFQAGRTCKSPHKGGTYVLKRAGTKAIVTAQ